MTTEHVDYVVIGGGRAANLAIAFAKKGFKTVLIERDLLGGTCPNRGCVPSKLLIGFAEASRRVHEADRHFVEATHHGQDREQVFAEVNAYVGQVDGGYEKRVVAAGVDLIRGEARFVGPKTVAAGNRVVSADHVILATGSRPTPPPFADLPVWTSDALFPLKEGPPESLMVIGGGFIGTEMASFFSGVGSKVDLFVRRDGLLNREDEDIEQVFREEFSKAVSVHFRSSLKALTYDGKLFTATFEGEGGEHVQQAERVLFAIGRIPNSDMLALEKTGLKANARGFVPVNEFLETEVPGIYAIGDINGRFMLQHAASFEAHYLRQRLLKGHDEPIDERLVAHAVFAHPEVASIGLSEQQLKESGTPYVSVFQGWLASARAMSTRLDYPRIKLLVSSEDYSILGCHLVGPESSTLLHQVMAVMRLRNDVRELANMIYIHPALNECILAAAVKAASLVRKAR